MSDNTKSITIATEQGLRAHQEDRAIFCHVDSGGEREGVLLALMDGHNGKGVAEYCKQNIPKLFSLGEKECVKIALKRLVAKLDEETREMKSGSTLSLVYIPKDAKRAYVAVLGDSPVIIFGDWHEDEHGERTNLNVSPEHNVRTNKEERVAAEARGGIYERGYVWVPTSGPRDYPTGIQLSRALGDCWMYDILNRKPEIYSVPLCPGSVVLLASDGLLGHTDSDAYKEALISISLGMILEKNTTGLLRRAKKIKARGFDDNATAIMWKGSGRENA